MSKSIVLVVVLVTTLLATTVRAQGPGIAKPELQRQQILMGMPRGETQEIRVFTANFKPGDKTVFHSHRFPVTVYILEGAFTLEMEGHETMTVSAGQSMTEPPHVKMTGFNRGTGPLRVVIFYVSDPGTPFLDLVPGG